MAHARQPHTTSDQGQWDTCCSRTSQSFVKYSVQVGIGLIVILFSMVQIINKVENPEIYFSMLSGTMGIFFPHPSLTPSTPMSAVIEQSPKVASPRLPLATTATIAPIATVDEDF